MNHRINRTSTPEVFPILIFDFDGTIGDSNAVYDTFFRDLLTEHGVPFRRSYSEELKTMTMEDSCDSISAHIGGALSAEEISHQLEEFLLDFYSHKVTAMPGALDYLGRIRAMSGRSCLVTATPRRLILHALSHLGLEGFFEHVLTPEDAGGRDKSHPDIYRIAMKRMGDPDPEHYCVFDDALAAVRSAGSVGMFTVGIFDPLAPGQDADMRKTCNLYIRDFRDLL